MNWRYFLINGITMIRVVAFPVLLWLMYHHRLEWFSWLLAICFFTDAIDGILARKLHVTSVFGTRLDSIGDDLTIVAGIIGMFVFKLDFLKEVLPLFIALLVLFAGQFVLSLVRYGRITSFHTYLAKIAAILQGSFLILLFVFDQPFYWLFYIAITVTAIELVEEIVLVFILKEWRANVKGLWWVLKRRSS